MSTGLLAIAGGISGAAGAYGKIAEEEREFGKQSLLQMALDKRAENLARWQTEESIRQEGVKAGENIRQEGVTTAENIRQEGVKAGESKLNRESAENIAKIQAGKPGAFEEKYNLLVKILGKAKADSLIEASLEKTEKGADAKAKLNAIDKMIELRDMGASLEDINQVARAGGVEEWVVKKIIKKEKHWYGDKDVEEETYGAPEKKGLLEDTATTTTGATGSWTAAEEETKKTSLDELRALVGDESTTTPGLLTPEKTPTKKELGSILEKPETYQRGIGFKPVIVKPGATSSIKEKIQGWAAQTQSEKGSKFGEGNLETALRQAGFGKNLAEVKGMAANLRKQYPNLSEEQLIEMVKKVAAGE